MNWELVFLLLLLLSLLHHAAKAVAEVPVFISFTFFALSAYKWRWRVQNP